MPTNVRLATIEDLPTLGLLLTYLHKTPPWRDEEEQAARATLRTILSQHGRGLMIAELAGEPIGTIDVIVIKNLTRGLKSLALIENIVVKPDFRRRGFGRDLVLAAIDFAESHSCYKLQIVSANQRDAAHHLYRSMGFDADVSGFRRYLVDV